ncbi:MAG TPA: hypothetical protein VH165_20500 [Kofleriaceae bacterium]|jgi:hypothetical protein|nr:hypothetical protein [Kofleriaceae bacterium]
MDGPPPPAEGALADEVRAALRELVDEIGAVSARIVEHDDLRTGVPARTLALGGGEYLRVELATRQGREVDVEAAFDRVARQLRAIRRRWEVARLPEIHVAAGAPQPTNDRISTRIESYLRALAGIDRANNAFVIRGRQLIAAARPPDELEATRWPFLARRALASHAPHSSHGEVVDPDAYAMSFWYDAALVVLLAEPYALDFVRHRCRQVARELANLLPLLDPDPETPAAIRRRPPTLP